MTTKATDTAEQCRGVLIYKNGTNTAGCNFWMFTVQREFWIVKALSKSEKWNYTATEYYSAKAS